MSFISGDAQSRGPGLPAISSAKCCPSCKLLQSPLPNHFTRLGVKQGASPKMQPGTHQSRALLCFPQNDAKSSNIRYFSSASSVPTVSRATVELYIFGLTICTKKQHTLLSPSFMPGRTEQVAPPSHKYGAMSLFLHARCWSY